MLLVGMLDSPYVRRTAIAATLLEIEFEHRSVSVFRHIDQFRMVNTLLKAPSLVANDGTVLMESELILGYLEDIAGRSLRPGDPVARLADRRASGLALVACDKAIAIEYERKRPSEIRHRPWVERVQAQLLAALEALDDVARCLWLGPEVQMTHGAIGAAVAWGFIRFVVPDTMDPECYPALLDHAERCEATPAFRLWPVDRETP